MTNPTDKQSDIVAELRGGMWSRLGRESNDQAQLRRIHLCKGAADELERLRNALEPFAHAYKLAETVGRPCFEFCGAKDYENANSALSYSATKETTE